jgi:hypothetical protein
MEGLVLYWVPVIVMLKLKFVRLPGFAATVNVNIAGVDAEAFRTVLDPRFQLHVKTDVAFDGFQALVAMVNVSGTLPEFLM